MTYNPFNKSIHDLEVGDLDLLVQNRIAEGYWVEYKREFPSKDKIAKSISSLANSYGGWYFIGVRADSNTNMATEIVGISLDEISDPVSKMRDTIKSNIDPVPLFYTRLIEIGFGKAVLVVEVPNDQDTPFITRSGQIYRRAGDSSDPVPENNRYAIDRLVENRREKHQRFIEFCNDERTFSRAEEEIGWVNIFLSPKRLIVQTDDDIFSRNRIQKLLDLSLTPLKFYSGNSEIGSGNVPLTTGQFGVGSIILRHVAPSEIAFNSLTVELFYNGRAKFHVPLSYFSIMTGNEEKPFHSASVQKYIHQISQSDNDYHLSLLHFFDIHKLWGITTNLCTLYLTCHGDNIQETDLRMVIKADNIWRSVPFYDCDAWVEHVIKFGLPVQNGDSMRIPYANNDDIAIFHPLWATTCLYLGMGFGLPEELFSEIFLKPINAPT